MDSLDPQKYIEEQRAKEQADQQSGAAQNEDAGSATGLITILVVLLSVLGYVVSFLLDMREAPEAPPAPERSEMATEFWGPESEPIAAEAPAGMFTEVFKFPVEFDHGVRCHFALDEMRPHDDWAAAVNVELGELGRSGPDVKGEEFVRIAAVFPAAEGGRDFIISTKLNERMHSFTFLHTAEPADEVWLMLGKRSDGDFVYTANTASGTYGTGTIHRGLIDPRFATVRVVGVKGVIDCEVFDI